MKRGSVLGGWTIGEPLGGGANGEVFRATRGPQEGAIKVLKRRLWDNEKAYARFEREVLGMERCSDIPGVVPLLDHRIPGAPTDADPPWLVMALAQPLKKIPPAADRLAQFVGLCGEIAGALTAMHERGVSHRDIKPENLFVFGGTGAVGDFGLIYIEGETPLTSEGEKLGPVYFIAPEMLNTAGTAAGPPADVYSLAKTLWVLATGQNYPLPGQMRRDEPALTISANVMDTRARLLDPVVEAATATDPAKRPTMAQLRDELVRWLSPPSAYTPTDDFDVTEYAREIEGINAPHYVQERRVRDQQEMTMREGLRLREHFRPLVHSVERALKQAQFISPRGLIEDNIFGFAVRGHILGVRGQGDVELQLEGHIWVNRDAPASPIERTGWAAMKCEYIVALRSAPRSSIVLWETSCSFLIGGTAEQDEIAKLIAEMSGRLRPAIARAIDISKNGT